MSAASKAELTAIGYDSIKVKGYSLERIQELKVVERLNEHTKLYLTGVLDKNEKDMAVHESNTGKKIEIVYGGEKKLFSGIVVYVGLVSHEGVNFLTVEALDAGYQMDITPKSRSFQDAAMTVKELVGKVIEGYPEADWKMAIPDVPIGQLIVQYEETDWEFLKRIASRYYAPLISDCRLEGIHFYIGVQKNKVTMETAPFLYYMEKSMDEYYFMKNNFTKDAKETDYTTYSLDRLEVYKLGDYLELEGQPFTIMVAVHEIKRGVLQNNYILRPENGLRREALYNHKISGCSIDGKIADINKAKVQVALKIDGNEGSTPVHWFPFSTMSASTDGSGWYCMPEKGDDVKVYFPDKKEEEAFAISAVSGYEQGAGETEDRMGDPGNKYLRTTHDKQVQLTAAGIFLSCNSGQAEASLQSDGTLVVKSNQNVTVTAKETIEIKAEETFKITSVEGINIQCDKGGALIFDKEGFVTELGTLVNNN